MIVGKDIVERLNDLSVCAPGCNGRCTECPGVVVREAAAEITALRAQFAALQKLFAAANEFYDAQLAAERATTDGNSNVRAATGFRRIRSVGALMQQIAAIRAKGDNNGN